MVHDMVQFTYHIIALVLWYGTCIIWYGWVNHNSTQPRTDPRRIFHCLPRQTDANNNNNMVYSNIMVCQHCGTTWYCITCISYALSVYCITSYSIQSCNYMNLYSRVDTLYGILLYHVMYCTVLCHSCTVLYNDVLWSKDRNGIIFQVWLSPLCSWPAEWVWGSCRKLQTPPHS